MKISASSRRPSLFHSLSPDEQPWQQFQDQLFRSSSISQNTVLSKPPWLGRTDLSSWYIYIDRETATSGSNRQHLTQWATSLGISEPSSTRARYVLLMQLIQSVQDCDSLVTLHGLYQSITTKHGKVSDDADSETALAAYQSLLTLLGCLTLTFKTDQSPRPHWSTICAPCSLERPFRPQSLLESDSGSAERAFGLMLASYGTILPEFSDDDGQLLHASILNYSAMWQWAHVNIQWVDHVGSHLLFNPMKRTLSIFAHPAYSAIFCSGEFRKDLICRIIEGYPLGEGNTAADTLHLMHQEVLLSYRLLFGWNSKSRQLFYSHRPPERMPDNDFLKALVGPIPRSRWKGVIGGPRSATYLKRFPHTFWPEATLNHFNVLEEADEYSSAEFAIFAPRLHKLQHYCSRRNPRKAWGMWQDRRNPREWITFWAVVLVGGLSLLLSLLQTILAAVQVRLAQCT
ncbi:hypothetical protein F5Y09DRAFT_298931, partial [Xylaria sp. FL1042]